MAEAGGFEPPDHCGAAVLKPLAEVPKCMLQQQVRETDCKDSASCWADQTRCGHELRHLASVWRRLPKGIRQGGLAIVDAALPPLLLDPAEVER